MVICGVGVLNRFLDPRWCQLLVLVVLIGNGGHVILDGQADYVGLGGAPCKVGKDTKYPQD